ncbi:hypothetical protein Aglo03_03200 [Actinokineospora globicatena]|uniref:Uncharacterized protein n=1 Tax=Actinokineospora globicatena TaxID=103729 RepID=A0A9W6QJ19_9PSEU|nr:hypothetical protein Aglo03_03200 [Actinokineospora globicatena]
MKAHTARPRLTHPTTPQAALTVTLPDNPANPTIPAPRNHSVALRDPPGDTPPRPKGLNAVVAIALSNVTLGDQLGGAPAPPKRPLLSHRGERAAAR